MIGIACNSGQLSAALQKEVFLVIDYKL